MVETGGQQVVRSLRKRIRAYDLVSGALLSVALSTVAITVCYRFFSLPVTPIMVIALIGFSALVSIYSSRKVSQPEVARFLNQNFPQLEESCELVLKPAENMNMLERLQAARVNMALASIQKPKGIEKKLLSSSIILMVALLISFVLVKMPVSSGDLSQSGAEDVFATKAKENILPEIKRARVSISPPAYTGKQRRQQNQFSITAEDGAQIVWELHTSIPVKELKLIFNDTQSLPLRSTNNERTEWTISKTIQSSGFYQVSLNGKLSDFYKLEVVKDQPTAIRILSPKQYTTVDFGRAQQVLLNVSVLDDYGIRNASISATVASGQGEGVSFKEQKLSFGQGFGGKQYQLNKLINLRSLGMQPGDELYFYVKAQDSRGQESRSDVYFVSIQDTAKLMNMDGMASGSSLVPEYFRSQRQIIIDTEKLLRDKDSISIESFNNRSNNLGIDQKMLRLRYGKFLGEEEESNAGGHADEGETNESIVLGDASKIMDSYSHKHDQAEDATFFEPELKKQLKETLAQMWSSELRLRTYKPREALPYEYKALRLLKDLQQKSRAYVAKTSLKTPQLKLEKRLTGELEKIGSPTAKRETTKNTSPTETLREAVAVLEKLGSGGKADLAEMKTLQQANMEILKRASANPSIYLIAVSAMRKILANAQKVDYQNIAAAEKALHRMLAPPEQLPRATEKPPAQTLSDQYFKNLTRQ